MMQLWALLTSIPELLRLISAIQKAAEEAQTDRKVREDIRLIHEAFTSKDTAKLNDIFNNRVRKQSDTDVV